MTALRCRVGQAATKDAPSSATLVYVYRNPHKLIRPWCWIVATRDNRPSAIGDAPIAHVALFNALAAAGVPDVPVL